MTQMRFEHLAGMTEAEIKQKLKDPWWRIRNLYYILDKEGRTVLFVPNEAQEKFIADLWFRNIVPKARQRGFSTVVQILMLDACLFVPNTSAAVIAQDDETAEKIMRKKIEFAYDRLPKFLREMIPLKTDNVRLKEWANGSNMQVSISARGDTLNWLHISEYGIICYEHPDRAEKIITGALAAAERGITVIESTAKGRDGDYYRRVKKALDNRDAKKKLTRKEFRLHFASWWDADEYELDPEGVIITETDHGYFNRLEAEIGRPVNARKRAWYVSTRENEYAGDQEKMWQEYPSTVEEAFMVSPQGVILHDALRKARIEGRISKVPFRQGVLVNTFWDLGVSDDIAIWFHQRVGTADHFIRFFQCSDVPYSFIKAELDRLAAAHGYVYGTHFLPHDGAHRRPGATEIKTVKDMLDDLHFGKIEIVPRVLDLWGVGIPTLRQDFSNYWFDEEHCKDGIEHLDNYRKVYSERMGVFTDGVMNNGHQHAADALRQKAQHADEVDRICKSGVSSSSMKRRRHVGAMAV